jgi:SAM-dependent methyltransferase
VRPDARSAGRLVARRVPRRLVGWILDRPPALEPFGAFERPDAPPVELLHGYRDSVKDRWRRAWWPVATLLALEDELPGDLAAVADEIRSGRTLPVPPETIAAGVARLYDERPELFAPPSRDDARYGMQVLEPARAAEVPLAHYRQAADELAAIASSQGIDLRRGRVLDVGCASGNLSYALAAVAGEVVGIDLDVERYVTPEHRARARGILMSEADGHRVAVEEGDVTALAYPDKSFDVVVSSVVLEHVRDPSAAFREIRRVLRPGGISLHDVEPWFGPRGGHSLCTLDFPWGHVRLGPEDFERYVRRWRPFEVGDAVDYHRHGFQEPRLTLDESRAAALGAGLDIVEWREKPLSLRDVHNRLATSELVADCRRLHPRITRRDLLTLGYRVLLRPR